MKRVSLLLLALICTVAAFGQRMVKMKQANTMRGTIVDGIRNDWVIGDVIFVQNETTIYCDSAIFNRARNSIEAYGKIKITEGDSVTVTALRLTYDGNLKVAYLRRNVIFTKLETAQLFTDFLDFDRKNNKAKYFNNGKLVDTTNVLTSNKGYFDLNTNIASFKTDVVGVNKDYTMRSDTLQYNSNNKTFYFQAHTVLEDKEGGKGLYESGVYDTRKKQSDLMQGDFQSPSYRIRGTRLVFDEMRKYYKAKGSVIMTSKEENMNIYGDDGYYDKKNGISKVYGHAYVERVTDEQDTIFISADTLLSVESTDPKKKLLLAYHHVKIFKNDLQGKADSLVYVSRDSTIYFFRDPVLWANDNQMTADSIRILLENKQISRIYMVSNSFVASIDTLANYNQIKGRRMTAYFRGKQLHHVNVVGNGESIYFALQEKINETEGKKEKFTIVSGMNKIICSNMKINFKEGKVNNISFYIKPDASFIPPHELKKDEILLKGFSWRGTDRPTREQVEQKKP